MRVTDCRIGPAGASEAECISVPGVVELRGLRRACPVAGLDMSLAHAGVCVDGHIATAVFPPSDKRFGSIFQWVTAELKRVEPGVMVIEGGAFGGHNLFDLGQASGSAIAAALNLGWAFVEVAPASLKRWATGHGHAPKELMGAAAVGRRGAPMPGSTRARREDAADAYLLWAWGVEHLE